MIPADTSADTTGAAPGTDVTICRFCGFRAQPDARFCLQCGHRFLGTPPRDIVRYARPLWQVGLFTMLSFSLYLFPMVARSARFAAEVEGRTYGRGRAVWRSLGLLVPFFNFRIVYKMAADVRDATPSPDDDLNPGMVTWAYAGALIVSRILPDGWALLVLPVLLAVVLPVQSRINSYCEYVEPGVTARRRIRPLGYVGVAAGTILAAFVLIAVISPSILLQWTGQAPSYSGPAPITFGHGIDTANSKVLGVTTSFHQHDHLSLIVHLSAPLSTTSLLRTVDLRGHGGALQRVDTDTLPVPDPTLYNFYEDNNLSGWLQSGPLGSGGYLLRYWRQGTVISQGTFTVVS